MAGATVITGGTYLLELSSGYDSSAFVLDDSLLNGPIGYVGGIQDRISNRPDVTINVSGGISSAADIGRSVVDALTQYTQVYGPLNLAIR